MSKYKSLLERFYKVKKEFESAVLDFPIDKRSSKLFDSWNIKDVLAHMTFWNKCLKENIRYIRDDKEPPFLGKVNEVNLKSVRDSKNVSWDEVYKQFTSSGKELQIAYENLPDKLWELPIWKGRKSTPLSFLKIVIIHYEKDHLPAILEVMKEK
jgi:hypothetical protein